MCLTLECVWHHIWPRYLFIYYLFICLLYYWNPTTKLAASDVVQRNLTDHYIVVLVTIALFSLSNSDFVNAQQMVCRRQRGPLLLSLPSVLMQAFVVVVVVTLIILIQCIDHIYSPPSAPPRSSPCSLSLALPLSLKRRSSRKQQKVKIGNQNRQTY